MKNGTTITAIIPALNEEQAIGLVLDAIPSWVDRVIVADNGSTDDTPEVAVRQGALVITEPRRGYGSACLRAMAGLAQTDIVVFLDGDFSDHPEEMDTLVDPITRDEADLVVGSRVRGDCEPGALTLQARFGNWLACTLLRWLWNVNYTDLGPFRAIRYTNLMQLGMRDPDYGWTVEMQIKAAIHGLRAAEVPVSYRPRIGRSKVSGTIRGVVGAATKIIYTIFASALHRTALPSAARDDHTLIVFTRYPEPGRVKTRLIRALGPREAAKVSLDMTAHTLTIADRFRKKYGGALEVRFAGGDPDLMCSTFGSRFAYVQQGPGDLGQRMARAFGARFAAGAGVVILIGTDCPALTVALIHQADILLRTNDVVLGPTNDGGYYLIGLRQPAPRLFTNVEWGTDTVLQETLRHVTSAGLSHRLLPTLSDVDRPEDLPVWHRMTGRLRSSQSWST